MAKARLHRSSINKPAPRWFRITKKVLNLVTNFTMGILLLVGYGEQSLVLLIVKLSQSFLMDLLDSLLSNGEVYAQEDTKVKQVTLTETTVDATKVDTSKFPNTSAIPKTDTK